MFDHIGIGVRDFDKSRTFYEKALAPLGISLVHAFTAEETGGAAAAGFGVAGKAYLWIGDVKDARHTHIAFTAQTRAMVDAFFKAALAAGATDNGGPGPRPHYDADYYGAFVLDPDGHNIEAVCRAPA